MGRYKLLDKRDDLTIEGLKDDYEELQTMAEVAAKNRISVRTLRNYFDEYNIPRKRGRIVGRTLTKPSRHYSKLVLWVRDNPGVRLPASIKEISKLTDCSRDAVKSYLYRRRTEAQKKANGQAGIFLSGPLQFFISTDGHKFPNRAFKTIHKVGVYKWSLKPYYDIEMKTGEIRRFILNEMERSTNNE